MVLREGRVPEACFPVAVEAHSAAVARRAAAEAHCAAAEAHCAAVEAQTSGHSAPVAVVGPTLGCSSVV